MSACMQYIGNFLIYRGEAFSLEKALTFVAFLKTTKFDIHFRSSSFLFKLPDMHRLHKNLFANREVEKVTA